MVTKFIKLLKFLTLKISTLNRVPSIMRVIPYEKKELPNIERCSQNLDNPKESKTHLKFFVTEVKKNIR